MAVLTLDDYVEARDKQDAAIREEFSKIDSRIDEMEARFDKTLTLDDYIESRNKQDAAIREEFSKIDSRFDEMGADIKSRFDEMYSVFNHIHWLIERSDAT